MFAPIAFSRTQSFTQPLRRKRALRGAAAGTALVATLGITALAGGAAVAEEGEPTPIAPVAVADSVTVPKRTTTWINVAENDSDADSIFFVKDITQPPGGQVYSVENTRFNYQSDYGFCGVDTMTYRLQDTTGLYSEWATVEITVPNENPVAADDQKQGSKNVMTTGDVLANDADVDDAAADLTVTWGTPSQPGFTGNSVGKWQWNLGTWGGVATIPYTVHDLCGGTDEGLLTVVVPEYGDDAPVLQPDAYSMVQDTVLTVDAPGVLANDDDPDGSPFQAMIIPSSANHGTVVPHPSDGSFTYTPDPGFVGKDTFIYQAIDSDLHKSAAAFVTITVTPATEPQAFWDLYWTPADTLLTVNGEGVLSNDVDAATAELVTDVSHGTLSLGADGKFTYQPDAGYVGSDSFQYRALNNIGPSNTVMVALEVGGNKPVWFNPPVAVADSATTVRGQAVSIKVRDNDTVTAPGGSTIVLAQTGAAHGDVEVTNQELGLVRYTPDAGYAGPDQFSYAIYDSRGVMSNWVTVSVVVKDDSNTAPVVTDLQLSRVQGSSVPSFGNAFDLVTDPEGNPVTITWDSMPAVGTFVHDIGTIGNWQWVPPSDFLGVETIVFTATDSLGKSAQGTITISVVEDMLAPVAVDDTYATTVGTTLWVGAASGLFANDSDADSQWVDMQVFPLTSGLDGTVSVAPDGSFEFTPTPGFNGVTAFLYKLIDDTGRHSNVAKVTINVGAAPVANAAPVAGGDTYTADADAKLTVASADGLLANDTDADGDQLTVSANSAPANGTVTVAADGSFEYTPNQGFAGSDSFEYSVTDGAATASATVVITVNAAPAGNPPANPEPGTTGTDEPAETPADAPAGTEADDESATTADSKPAAAEASDTRAQTLAAGDDAEEAADEAAEAAAVKDEETGGAPAGSDAAASPADSSDAAPSGPLWLAVVIGGACIAAGIWVTRRLRARSNAAAA